MSGEGNSRPRLGIRRKPASPKAGPQQAGASAPKSGAVSVVLTAVFALAAALVGWFGAIETRGAIRTAKDETAALRRETAQMREVIAGRDATLKAVSEVMREHAAFSGAVLEPLLGSYAMRAKTLLEGEADACGLSNLQFADVNPPALLPAVPSASRTPYVLRSVRVTATGSYQRLVSFLCRVERTQPLVLVDSVTISAEFAGTVQQRGVFVFTWLSDRDGEVKP